MVVGDAYMIYQNAVFEVGVAFDSVLPILLAVLQMKEILNHPFYHELPTNALRQMPPTIGFYPMKNDSKKEAIYRVYNYTVLSRDAHLHPNDYLL